MAPEKVKGFFAEIFRQAKEAREEKKLRQNTKSSSGMDIPDYQFEAIARCLLSEIQKYYESEEGQREFAEWQAKQESKRENDNPKD